MASLYLTEDLSAGELSAEQREQRVVEILAARQNGSIDRIGLPVLLGDEASVTKESLDDFAIAVATVDCHVGRFNRHDSRSAAGCEKQMELRFRQTNVVVALACKPLHSLLQDFQNILSSGGQFLRFVFGMHGRTRTP